MPADSPSQPLLRVSGLKKNFPLQSGLFSRQRASVVRAVDGADFEIAQGETFGLVGETGCGKSTLGRLVLRLYPPTAGDVEFRGQSILKLRRDALRRVRSEMQMVFQDPYGSLNPRMRVGEIIAAPLTVMNLLSAAQRRDRARELMREVGLDPKLEDRYPHQFSGGQRQRIAIARALATSPSLVVADEPISALDVSMQAQILNLLMDLQEQHGLTYLFIAHDLNVVRHISDQIAVMYLGRIVETGPSAAVYDRPLHPYTRALMSAVPVADPVEARSRRRIVLAGDPPSPVARPAGCRFSSRCPIVAPICHEKEPELVAHEPGHFAACFFPGKLS